MTDYQTILTERHGDVLVITLNRPDRLNAASLDMAGEITAALADLGGSRAVVLTGAGRAFCSGADLQSRGDRAGAAGIGCSIALAGDFAIAARSAYFLQAFVNIGLVPDGGASWMLPRLIGKARATQMMMLGEKIDAQTADDWGLIYRCVDDAALLGVAMDVAHRLAAGPTLALGVMRANLKAALDSDYPTALAREADGQRTAAGTADAVEGAMAFLQKRKPVFTGA